MKTIILLITMFISVHAISIDEKVAYLNNVKELIILTQKMRGDTNVYIKSDGTDMSIIEEDRKKVFNSFEQLHMELKISDISIDEEFRRLNKYMNSLNTIAVELEPLVTFKANSLLIKKMLEIGDDVQKNFFTDENDLHKKASFVMMKRVMPMTEHLGQLRGLTSGIIACGNCNDNDDDLEYIKDYLAYAYDDLNELIIQMKLLKKSYPKSYPNNLDYQLHRYEVDIKHYLKHIEDVVLEKTKIKSSECDFFAEGTRLIDMTLVYYNMNEAVLKNQGI